MKTLSAILLLLVFAEASAQTVVSGIVKDSRSRPAAFATIMLLRAKDSSLVKGSVSDSAGKYIIEGVAAGKYLVAASQIGAGRSSSSIFTADSARRLVSLEPLILAETGATLKAVEVTARKPYIEMLADKTVLNVENSVIAAGNTIFEVLRRAPGVRTDHQDNIILMGVPGVEIWIDGRPSNMSGETLAQWLKSQPADVVSKIEIISNPSSRFDAAGSAGIINIRLKKNVQQGLNGNIFLGGGMGKYPKASSGLNMNYRQGKVNLYGNYNYYYSESYNLLTFTSVTDKGNGQTDQLHRENYWHPFTNSQNAKLGVDYNLTSKTTLGFIANLSNYHTNSRTDAVTKDFGSSKPIPSYLNALTNRRENFNNYRFNLNLLTNIDSLGSNLVVDADVASYTKGLNEDIVNDLTTGTGPETRIATIRNLAPADVWIASAKADYTKYFSKSFKMEAGLKASYVKTDSDIRYDSLLQDKWVPDILRTNHFRYTENIQAAYTTLSYDLKKWSFQAGLRAERTDAEGLSVTLDSLVRNRYINLFPTVFVLYRLTENQQLTFSYGKRINRPSYQSLNPFTRAIDPYTFIEGNPYLRPQFNHVFQLKHNFHQWLYTTAYYAYTKDYSGSLLRSDTAAKVIITRPENMGHGEYGYVAVTAVVPITKWWETETNIGVGFARYKSDLADNRFDNKGYGAEMSTNFTFILPRKVKLQLSADYSTPAPNGQARNRRSLGMDIGIQKNLFNDKGSIRLNIADPFNTRRYDADIFNNGTTVRWINRWENRKVNVQFVWKFGNQKIKAARNRNTGSKEEENRVNL